MNGKRLEMFKSSTLNPENIRTYHSSCAVEQVLTPPTASFTPQDSATPAAPRGVVYQKRERRGRKSITFRAWQVERNTVQPRDSWGDAESNSTNTQTELPSHLKQSSPVLPPEKITSESLNSAHSQPFSMLGYQERLQMLMIKDLDLMIDHAKKVKRPATNLCRKVTARRSNTMVKEPRTTHMLVRQPVRIVRTPNGTAETRILYKASPVHLLPRVNNRLEEEQERKFKQVQAQRVGTALAEAEPQNSVQMQVSLGNTQQEKRRRAVLQRFGISYSNGQKPRQEAIKQRDAARLEWIEAAAIGRSQKAVGMLSDLYDNARQAFSQYSPDYHRKVTLTRSARHLSSSISRDLQQMVEICNNVRLNSPKGSPASIVYERRAGKWADLAMSYMAGVRERALIMHNIRLISRRKEQLGVEPQYRTFEREHAISAFVTSLIHCVEEAASMVEWSEEDENICHIPEKIRWRLWGLKRGNWISIRS